jgi:hypothetical protein
LSAFSISAKPWFAVPGSAIDSRQRSEEAKEGGLFHPYPLMAFVADCRMIANVRYKLFAMGGYRVKDGNRRILRLSLSMKRREWFLGLWEKVSRFSLPVTLSTLNAIA